MCWTYFNLVVSSEESLTNMRFEIDSDLRVNYWPIKSITERVGEILDIPMKPFVFEYDNDKWSMQRLAAIKILFFFFWISYWDLVVSTLVLVFGYSLLLELYFSRGICMRHWELLVLDTWFTQRKRREIIHIGMKWSQNKRCEHKGFM